VEVNNTHDPNTEETKILDYGRCIIDSSAGGYGTKYTMKKCEDGQEENQENCIVKGRENLAEVCQKECMKYDDSVAFAISDQDEDDICRCFPKIVNDGYTGSYELDPDSRLTCYAMEGEDAYEIGVGNCVPSQIYTSRSITEFIMKVCPQVEKLLRGSVSA